MDERFASSVVRDGYDLALAKSSVGPGWHNLLKIIFAAKPDGVKIIQVKEKFGGLRVYTSSGPARIDLIADDGIASWSFSESVPTEFDYLLRDAEEQSRRICEMCGELGTPRPHRWIKTLCDACDLASHGDGTGGPSCQFTEHT